MSAFAQLDADRQQLRSVLENYARAQALNSLSLELICAQGLAPFSRILTARLAELFGCKGSVLALTHGDQVRIMHLQTESAMLSARDRKSTRLNSSHRCISYAVFCLKKKTNI